MTIEMAREIVRQAHKYGLWEPDHQGQTVEDLSEEQVYALANEAVTVARQGYDNGSQHEGVVEILFAAQVEPVQEGDRVKYADVYQRKGVEPPAASGGQASAGVFASDAGAPAPEDPGLAIEDIYPGYDEQKAREIVTAVKESAASGDLSPEEWERIKAYEAANEERKSILELQPEFKPKPTTMSAAISPSTATAGTSGATQTWNVGDYASAADLERAYGDGTLGMDRVGQERLPIPPEFQGDEPILPVDITDISHQELSRLASTFNSLEARSLWLLSQEEGRAEAATSLRQDAHRAAFSREFERIKSGIEKQTGTALEAARSEANKIADDDSVVITWRNRERRHSIEAGSLRALLEGYERTSARLSREQTRREKLASNGG